MKKIDLAQEYLISKALPDTFKSLVSTDYMQKKAGIVRSVLLRDDTVFAIIAQTDDDHVHDDGIIFNTYPYEEQYNALLPEILIPTDINPIGNDINRYVGSRALVTMQDGIAIFATVFKNPVAFTTISASTIRRVRNFLAQDTNGRDVDLFGAKAQSVWQQFGILQEEIKQLKGLMFKPENHLDKTLTIKGEGNWSKDTSSQVDNELILELNELMQGLNQQGMKDNDCHLPTRLFSAK